MTLSRTEHFIESMGFKLLGDMIWGDAVRKATPEEKKLWHKCIELIEEIDLAQPVEPCKHPDKNRIIKRVGDRVEWAKCGICNEYIDYAGIYR